MNVNIRTDFHIELVDSVVGIPVGRLVGAEARRVAEHRARRRRGGRVVRVSTQYTSSLIIEESLV